MIKTGNLLIKGDLNKLEERHIKEYADNFMKKFF